MEKLEELCIKAVCDNYDELPVDDLPIKHTTKPVQSIEKIDHEMRCRHYDSFYPVMLELFESVQPFLENLTYNEWVQKNCRMRKTPVIHIGKPYKRWSYWYCYC